MQFKTKDYAPLMAYQLKYNYFEGPFMFLDWISKKETGPISKFLADKDLKKEKMTKVC